MITSKKLRQLFLDFMASKGHSILPSASLVPREDPTILFNTAGMQPLVPFLMGQPHPQGNRLANSQLCVRTDDIEEVGDNRHHTFFEMLGSWSLGDYWKKDSIAWGFEFLTGKDWLNLDPNRLYVTVFKGYNEVGADEESIQAWNEEFAKVGITANVGTEYNFKKPEENESKDTFIYRITKKSGKDNWWGLPYRGPCGPCTEIYYLQNQEPVDFQTSVLPNLSLEEVEKFLDDQIVEIWNHVFMEFIGEKTSDKEPLNLELLSQKNVDTGMGFERLLAVLNSKEFTQETDALEPIWQVAQKWSQST